VQLVLPVDVGDAAGPAARRRGTQGPGRPPGPARGVDHQVGRDLGAVHPDACRPAGPAGDAVDVTAADREAGLGKRRRPQRGFERDPAGAHPHGDLGAVGQRHPHHFGAVREPPAKRLGKLLLQRLRDLDAERVSVVELHDPEPGPAAVRGRPGVSLHRDYLVAPARQPGTSEQAGGACPDDGYSHGRTSFATLDSIY
jgi:hypothetical protein